MDKFGYECKFHKLKNVKLGYFVSYLLRYQKLKGIIKKNQCNIVKIYIDIRQ